MKALPIHLVAHVFLRRSEQVLLVRRAGTGFNDGKYGLPGGHLEGYEVIQQAAIRECREEVGVELEPADLKMVGVSHYFSQTMEGIIFFLSASRWTGEPYARSECDEVLWTPLDALPEATTSFVRRAVARHLQTGEWFDEII